jgi:hypothetical protein
VVSAVGALAGLISTAIRTALGLSEAAHGLGLQIQILNASTSREIEVAFATLVRERPDAASAHGSFWHEADLARCPPHCLLSWAKQT